MATWRVARARFGSKERPRNDKGQYSPLKKWNYSHFCQSLMLIFPRSLL